MDQEIEIKISAKWESELQRSVSYQALIILPKAWTAFRRATHKKNSVELIIDGDDIDNVQPDGV